MLTTNNWRLEKLTDEEREWVASNCIAVHIDSPVFEATSEKLDEASSKRPRCV